MKKNIFITGVSSGIGEYLAEKLSDQYEIYGLSRNFPKNDKIKFFKCDLNDENQILDVIDKIKNVDIFVFNAGLGYFGDYISVNLDQEKEMLNVNLVSNMIFIKNLLPIVSLDSKFIFMGSVAAKNIFKGGVGYQTSKFALRGFVGSLAKEYKNRFFLINPKIVDTNFHKNSQIKIDDYKKTTLQSIYKVVNDIIDGNQISWEIDV